MAVSCVYNLFINCHMELALKPLLPDKSGQVVCQKFTCRARFITKNLYTCKTAKIHKVKKFFVKLCG